MVLRSLRFLSFSAFIFLLNTAFSWAANNTVPPSLQNPGFARLQNVPVVSVEDYAKIISKRKVSSNVNKTIKPSSPPSYFSALWSYLDGSTPPSVGGDPAPASVADMARSLKYNPDLIYQYVHDNIKYYPVWGVQKGAWGALVDGNGTAFDQAALMVELLKATPGNIYNPQYVYGTISISPSDLANWYGMDVSGGFAFPENMIALCKITAAGFIPANFSFQSGYAGNCDRVVLTSTVTIAHVWVSATIGGNTYYFDPARKLNQFSAGMDDTEMNTALGYSGHTTYMSSAVTSSNAYSVSVDRDGIRNTLKDYATHLVDHLKTNDPDATLDTVVGGAQVIPVQLDDTHQTSLPYQVGSVTTWTDIPLVYKPTIRIQYQGIDVTYTSDEIYGKRLTVMYIDDSGGKKVPQLILDGVQRGSNGKAARPGVATDITLTVVHAPYAFPSANGVLKQSIKAGGTYSIVNSWGQATRSMAQYHQQKMEEYRVAGGAVDSETVAGEMLSQLGFVWLSQLAQTEYLLGQIGNTTVFNHHNVGIAGQMPSPDNAPYIDLTGNLVASVNWDNEVNKEIGVFAATIKHASVLESTAVHQVTGSEAVSTVSLFDTQSGPFYKADSSSSSNYNGIVKPLLQNYSSKDLSVFNSLVNSGNTLLLPQNGKLGKNEWDWKGKAYFMYTKENGYLKTLGALIEGNLYGGFSINKNYTFNLSNSSAEGFVVTESNVDFFNDSGSLRADPVDNFRGSFIHTHDDLVVGQGAFPYALGFQSYYSSAARNQKSVLGNGFTHNYAITAKKSSDGYQGLGEDSALDAAAAIAEMYVAVDLLGDTTTDFKEMIVATMGIAWLSEQITDNVVVVTKGASGEYFVKLPDGTTYNPPPKSAAKLTLDSQTNTYQYETPDKTAINFNSTGNATTWKNAADMEVTFAYTGDQLTTVSNSLGRTLNLHYTTVNTVPLLTSVDDGAGGRSVSYGYDTHDNLTSFTDANSKITKFTYATDPNTGQLKDGVMYKMFTPLFSGAATQAAVTNTYDSVWRVKSQVDIHGNKTNFYLAGRRTELQYVDKDAANNDYPDVAVLYNDITYNTWWGDPSSTTDAMGNVTQYEYDGLQRLVKTIKPEGDCIKLTYDSVNSISNLNNVLKQRHYAKGANCDGEDSSTFTEQLFAYDAKWNKVNQVTDENLNVTTANYDSTTGNLLSVTYPDPGDGNGAPTVNYTYNSLGQLLTQTDPSQVTSEARYDSEGNVTDFFEVTGEWNSAMLYTPLGDVQQVAETGDTNVITEITYDNLRRKLTETLPDPDGSGPQERPFIRYEYDDNGNLTKVGKRVSGSGCSSTLPAPAADATCQVTQTTYTNSDKPSVVTDTLGHTTTYTYDKMNRVSTVTKNMGADPTRKIITEYDSAGRVYKEASEMTSGGCSSPLPNPGATANCEVTKKTYTANGQLYQLTDSRNNVTTYAYDNFDRPQTVAYADGSYEEYSNYDKVGNAQTFRTRSGSLITFEYDALNRKKSKSPANQATVEYGYDKNSRLTSAKFTGTLSAGDANVGTNIWSQTYDARGQLKTATTPDGKTVEYGYDQYKNRTSMRYPDGFSLVYRYDQLKRLTDVVSINTFQSFAQYSYDTLSRVTARSAGVNATYGYFDHSNLLQTINDEFTGSLSFTYNYANQIKTRTVSDSSYLWTPAAPSNKSYGTANAVNQYMNVDGKSFFYDGNGNLHNDGQFTYTYDTENRLVSAVSSSTTATYKYDPFGRRYSKTVDGVTTRYLHDGTNEIAEYDGSGTLLRKHVFVGSSFIATIEGSTTSYAHKDIQGSVIAMTSSTGTTSYTYSPYGQSGATQPTSFGYTGQRFDPETGNYYYKARYYNPRIGRFLQTDPIGYADGLNMYAYTGNDPINFRDPTGLSKFELASGSLEVDFGLNGSKTFTSRAQNYQAMQDILNFSGIDTVWFGVASELNNSFANNEDKMNTFGTYNYLNNLGESLYEKNVQTFNGLITRTDSVSKNSGLSLDYALVRREQNYVQDYLKENPMSTKNQIMINSSFWNSAKSYRSGDMNAALDSVTYSTGDFDFSDLNQRIELGYQLMQQERH